VPLLRVGRPGQERPCAIDADGVVRDVSSLVGDWSGDALDPDFLRAFERRFAPAAPSLPVVDVTEERVGPPVPAGGHILSIGLNYRDHAAQAGMEPPDEPIVSSKAPWSMAGPYDDLILPPESTKTDWEVELAVVIGRRAQYLPDRRSALDHVAGYCTVNDISERGWLLERGGQWIKGKSFESFNPLGPWLATTDEITDLRDLRLTCHVNGRLMQDGNTSAMIFDVAHLVWYLSQFLVLQPGDIINTGSPAGIALGRPDEPYLRPGDIVEVEVGGLGRQRKQCRPACTRIPVN
jgi:2-keto-4-pentenoate hydratase/2-oxohepta-3-ene-1,7-dioic acid hydratase in catechol pathway